MISSGVTTTFRTIGTIFCGCFGLSAAPLGAGALEVGLFGGPLTGATAAIIGPMGLCALVAPIFSLLGGTALLIADCRDTPMEGKKHHKYIAITLDLLILAGAIIAGGGFFSACPAVLAAGVGISMIATLLRVVLYVYTRPPAQATIGAAANTPSVGGKRYN